MVVTSDRASGAERAPEASLRSSSRVRRPQGATLIRVLVVGGPVLALVVAGWHRRWTSDDGFITMRVVDQLLAGNGPVFNVGERVEAATSPAWALLLALTSTVTGGAIALEWLAVLLGIAGAAGGLALASWGALVLHERSGPGTWGVPLGALAVVALSPFWDYATAGLETGLVLLWLGSSFAALSALTRQAAPRRRSVLLTAALIGTAPLVRPDLAVIAFTFLAALLVVLGPVTWRARITTLAAAAALPVVWQVVRMAYFASLVPNPALAKEASEARWDQGWEYLVDLMTPYHLWFPLGVIGGVAAIPLLRHLMAVRRRAALAVALAAIAGGLVHGLYVVRVGGDFMHGRLLLPSLFALLLPVMIVRLDRARAAAAVVVAAWALVAAVGLRTTDDGGFIVDERVFYVNAAGHPNPVVLEHFGPTPWAERGRELDRFEALGRDVVVLSDRPVPVEVAGIPGSGVVTVVRNIGMTGRAADLDVHIVDHHGLAGPIGARLELVARSRPGHEKLLDEAWALARFADPAAPLPEGVDPEQVAAARRALGCDPVQDLMQAVTSPLSVGRALRNIAVAPRFHTLRVPGLPTEAVATFCERG